MSTARTRAFRRMKEAWETYHPNSAYPAFVLEGQVRERFHYVIRLIRKRRRANVSRQEVIIEASRLLQVNYDIAEDLVLSQP